ncbi:hypothetical protein MUN53_04795 [Parabacteroides sp. AGMB00274]|uniref:Uncharacterized protein n=1 Tax=Parabacteroides faecalis TaxID=2924040 RepID=A0ABT0BYS8_9BACT|nr:hypothetical protein [Parabacteroides faecalis]MCI7285524.1 hypothetical protein [Parabacteroides sp.]MCJ2379931.1 hypothetical protein [Parabacteroides faecalis]
MGGYTACLGHSWHHAANSNSSSDPGDCVYTRLCLSPGNYPDDPESGPQDQD